MDPKYSHCLEVVVTALTGLTAGGMAFITIIDAPARSKLPPKEQLVHWRTSFIPSAKFFKPTGMALASALLVCAKVTEPRVCAQLYCTAAALFASLGPFTVIAIAPTNTALLESDPPASKEAEDKISGLVSGWAKLHAVRSAMGISGFALAMTACTHVRKW